MVENKGGIAVRRELVLFIFDVLIWPLQHDGARKRIPLLDLCRASSPVAAFVQLVRGAWKIARWRATLRHSAVSDAACPQPKILIGLFEQHAPVFVTPVPRENPLAAQYGAKPR